jgi:hypothetical protein
MTPDIKPDDFRFFYHHDRAQAEEAVIAEARKRVDSGHLRAA